jgi:hypothetical protein
MRNYERNYTLDPSFPEYREERHEYFDSGSDGPRVRQLHKWLIVDANDEIYCEARWDSEREANEDMKAFAQNDVTAVRPLRVVREDRFESELAEKINSTNHLAPFEEQMKRGIA